MANNTFFCGVTNSEHILNFDFTGTSKKSDIGGGWRIRTKHNMTTSTSVEGCNL